MIPVTDLAPFRAQIRALHRTDESALLEMLVDQYGPDRSARDRISADAVALINEVRTKRTATLMEVFLAEYGLSTDEGVALMCLAEALLRVPDAQTMDELIEDKIAPSAWGEHLGQSSSSLVNASTWALMLTGKVLQEPAASGVAQVLQSAVRRVGEPVIRTAVKQAMREMGHTFVLGEDIHKAMERGSEQTAKGYTYSYDMLGEAALTAADARTFYQSYQDAISAIANNAVHDDTRKNPGISIKLSALHPRYEVAQHVRVLDELVPCVLHLALMAKEAKMGLNIDAEEANRLDLSLDIIEAVLRSPQLNDWDGFGVVVQGYGKRASAVIEWLHALAKHLDRTLMVRLVKGAYWDSEIKQAQVDGVSDFPVFTNKSATDASYICCAKQLLQYSDRLYPQFATHNAHTICAILAMAEPQQQYEFQRLHGMGEMLHQLVMEKNNGACRIYAPVGTHRDLLAYLVRRLLENGANSSFLNQLVDESIAPELIAKDPFQSLDETAHSANAIIVKPSALFQPLRINSRGWDLRDLDDVESFNEAREPYKHHQWQSGAIVASDHIGLDATPVLNPNDSADQVGSVQNTSDEQLNAALEQAEPWQNATAKVRHAVLNKAADLYEKNAGEIFAVLCREAGKTPVDAVAEIREAVDFLRYYASEAIRWEALNARGIITCISPWNFPLAIFTGQISAALAAGNGVLAKPAEPTPIIANIAVKLLHQAGVPVEVLQLLPGDGERVGATLTTDPRVNGICFTGSTDVARIIYKQSSKTLAPDSTFIAETGGLNAMIVDSSALPEQAVQDIVDSAFRSCGQRCSALRVLYIQSDVAENFLRMLFGAMDELCIENSWEHTSDLGPVITEQARAVISNHIEAARIHGKLLKQLQVPDAGLFIGPAVIEVDGILSLDKEIFGPVLHIATFEANEIDTVVNDINNCGYGLTFGVHTRIDDRVESITNKLNVGNLYVNRNQIGAVVGSQPFGGEGLSGTGPKAGGPHYVKRFKQFNLPLHAADSNPQDANAEAVQLSLNSVHKTHTSIQEVMDMPGPTGESNRWSAVARGTILCLGPTAQDAEQQMQIACEAGCSAVGVAPGLTGEHRHSGVLSYNALTHLDKFAAVALWSTKDDLKTARIALTERLGPMVPLIATDDMSDFCVLERHLCIDTTASGGNAQLLASEL